jgi:MerR family transcriptional regulator/heat shock protein HspR
MRGRQGSVETTEDLPIYPIRTAAALTDVPARRIRSWENEYRLLRPARSRGGHRLYSTRDIRLIRRIRHLIEVEGMSLQGIRAWLEERPELQADGKIPQPA